MRRKKRSKVTRHARRQRQASRRMRAARAAERRAWRRMVSLCWSAQDLAKVGAAVDGGRVRWADGEEYERTAVIVARVGPPLREPGDPCGQYPLCSGACVEDGS